MASRAALEPRSHASVEGRQVRFRVRAKFESTQSVPSGKESLQPQFIEFDLRPVFSPLLEKYIIN